MRRVLWRSLVIGLLALAGCPDPAPATQVTVVFSADVAVTQVAREIEIVAYGGPRGEALPRENMQRLRLPIEDIEGGWPITHTLAPIGNDATRLYQLEARVYDATNPAPVATVRAISGYVPERSLVLRLRFYAQCLYLEPCENPEFSCDVNGDCQPSRVDARGLPDVPEGGIPRPVEPACRTDIDCDDGVACTEDTCLRGSCVRPPRDERCTAFADGVCDSDNGCQYGDTCDDSPTGNCQPTDACEVVRCEADVCVRETDCTAPAVCCGGACVLCNDGDSCTADGCDEAAGTCRNAAAEGADCDDGRFCTGPGRCVADGTCETSGDPCGDGTTCDEAERTCVGCMNDAQCATADRTRMGPCMEDPDATPDQVCMGAGIRMVTTISHTCRAGTCIARESVDPMSACTVPVADGDPCDTSEESYSGMCQPVGAGGLCDPAGIEFGETILWECQAGSCEATADPVPISRSCTRTLPDECRASDAGVDGGFDSGVDSGFFDTGVDSTLDMGVDSGCRCVPIGEVDECMIATESVCGTASTTTVTR